MLIDIHQLFPRLISSVQSSSKLFKGYIPLAGKDYYINISVPFFPKSKNLHISGDIMLLKILQDHTKNLIKNDDEDTFLDFLHRLSLLDKQMKDNNSVPLEIFDHYSFASDLMTQFEAVGWKNIYHVSTDFSKITLKISDERGRVHLLKLNLTSMTLNEPPIYELDLPVSIQLDWKTDQPLYSLYNEWANHISTFQLFWDVMDNIDETALVLDPLFPARRHFTRWLLLENKVTLKLTISPIHPLARPKCNFIGPSSLVANLNEKILQNYENWNAENGIIEALENLIGIGVSRKKLVVEDASQSTAAEGAFEGLNFDCGVCYELHLGEHLPDLVCNHCLKKFHFECLYLWLKGLPSAKLSCNFIRGDCPFCTKEISCKVP